MVEISVAAWLHGYFDRAMHVAIGWAAAPRYSALSSCPTNVSCYVAKYIRPS